MNTVPDPCLFADRTWGHPLLPHFLEVWLAGGLGDGSAYYVHYHIRIFISNYITPESRAPVKNDFMTTLFLKTLRIVHEARARARA